MEKFDHIRYRLALAAGKATRAAIRLIGRDGGHYPGSVATALDPQFLAHVAKPERTVFVMGTNGKTTTANLLNDILSANGFDLAANRAGSNITQGIAATLIGNTSLGGTAIKDTALMELDELHSRLVLPYVPADYVLVTNLYRDGFVRNANPEYVGGVISRALQPDTTLVLNADELISARLAPQCEKRIYFSVGELASDTREAQGKVSDLPVCPECGGRIEYDYCHLRHLGKLHCSACGYTNPEPHYLVTRVHAEPGCSGSFTMRECAEKGAPEYEYAIASFSITNLYNLAAAIVMARQLGLSPEAIAATLAGGVEVVKTRYNEQEVCGVRLVDMFTKGWNIPADSAVFKQIREAPGTKAVVVMLNDHHMEGRADCSNYTGWTYSADFEYLADDSVTQVVFAGDRCDDFALSALTAGIAPERITCCTTDDEVADSIRLEGVNSVYWCYELYSRDIARRGEARVAERLRQARGE